MIASLWTDGHAFGHLGYLLLVASMMMRKIAILRGLAIASGVASVVYALFFVYDPVTVVWQSLFVGVNVIQVAILEYDRWRAHVSDDEEHFIETVVPNLHRALSLKLIRAGTWKTANADEPLAIEGRMVPELVFVSDGKVRIEKDGQTVAQCTRGDFVGEISFITHQPATADAFAVGLVRYLSFEREALRRVLAAERELRHALESSFNRNLIDKLVKSNESKLGEEPVST